MEMIQTSRKPMGSVAQSVHAWGVVSLLVFFSFYSEESQARLIQIIHTNDLHSHFDHSENTERGGYAQIKAKIDELKAAAKSIGASSIVLDAGDLSEGTPYFLADQGEQSWRMIDAMGYDAIAIGNHDYMMGQKDLNRILTNTNPQTPFVVANFKIDAGMDALKKHFHPYVTLNRAGLKIAIFGLTTDEFMYKWMAGKGRISAPAVTTKAHVQELRANHDVVIALTHLGVDGDKKLDSQVDGFDAIVGGHSHTLLNEVVYAKRPSGQMVPIVQSGQHGNNIGEFWIDAEPGQAAKVVSYKTHPVYSAGPSDHVIANRVRDARTRLEVNYGADWLYEKVGESKVDMEAPHSDQTPWGHLMGQVFQLPVHADLSLDPGHLLYGDDVKAGDVTREKLFQFYPRVFKFDQKEGWTVWSTSIRGWVFKLAIEQAAKQGFVMQMTGIDYEWSADAKGNPKLTKLKINGQKFHPFRLYKVGLPEGVGRALRDIFPILRLIFHHAIDSQKPIWTEMEAQLKAVGGVID